VAKAFRGRVQRSESFVPQAPRPDLPPSPTRSLGWEELARRLLAYARRLGASAEEAEDLVQESLVVAVRDPDWYDRDRASLVTVLGAVLRNRLVDRFRHLAVRQRLAPRLRVLEPDEDPGPDETLALADARERRRALLSLLEPAERDVFGAWLQQRRGTFDGPGAAASIGMTYPEYESAKKRLRRRCQRLLDELGLVPADLFDPDRGAR
jgi:DNA-directed RNA polymerase specialized sigma24 family protein